jgi:Ca-activated chloride channel family protein
VKVAQVFKRLHGPVLADATLETFDREGHASTRLIREMIPGKLPDVFEDDQLIVLGQYIDKGPIKFKLSGNYRGQARNFEFEFDVSGAATTRNAFVPRLWASRRIAFLVDQIRQSGAESGGRPSEIGATVFNDPRFRELTDEILRLSIEFGILTEYTAFLATEGTNLSDWNGLRLGCGTVLNDRAVRSRSGQTAVNQGINFNDQKQQGKVNYQNRYLNQQLEHVEFTTVQQVNDRAFFKCGSQWIDGHLIDAPGSDVTPDETIAYGSPEHLDLLHKLIAQNRQGVLSLDGDIMIQFEGRNILVRNEASARSE